MSKKYVFVTGANRGIGLAIAERFARENFRVLMGVRDLALGEKEAERLRYRGLDVMACQLDVSNGEAIDQAIAAITAKNFQISVLINNAGVLPPGDLLTIPWSDVEETLAVHLLGPLRLARALIPKMTAAGFGRIVNVSSEWGSFSFGLHGTGAYGVAKAALNAMTLRLSREAPSCIKINAMCPGWVRTRMGGANAPRTPEQAADTAFWLGTLPDSGPSGGFFRDRKKIKW